MTREIHLRTMLGEQQVYLLFTIFKKRGQAKFFFVFFIENPAKYCVKRPYYQRIGVEKLCMSGVYLK